MADVKLCATPIMIPTEVLPQAEDLNRIRLYDRALVLAWITIFYNLAEGLISIMLGLQDETLALFGFGIDSFVEVISGIGIWHMVRRLKRQIGGQSDPFERRALQVTGTAFYLLAAGLVASAVINLVQGHHPETTFWGIVISLVSILTMGMLIRVKVQVGRALHSDAILADAACTRACLYLSFVLLAASGGTLLTGIGGLDALGAVGISVFAFREGREAFETAAGKTCSCSHCP